MYRFLTFCNGFRIAWQADDTPAGQTLAEIAAICGWSVADGPQEADVHATLHTGTAPSEQNLYSPWTYLLKSRFQVFRPNNDEIHFYMAPGPYSTRQLLFIRRLISFLPLAKAISAGDATIVHGALATREDGRGFLFCGDSGAGKSTSLAKLPDSWVKHCDDAMLLVRRPEGYFAHTLPTWTKWFRQLEPVEYQGSVPVPVHELYLLNQSNEDSIEELPWIQQVLGVSRSMIFLQYILAAGMPSEESKTLKVCALDFAREYCREYPVRKLNSTLHGEFWKNFS